MVEGRKKLTFAIGNSLEIILTTVDVVFSRRATTAQLISHHYPCKRVATGDAFELVVAGSTMLGTF